VISWIRTGIDWVDGNIRPTYALNFKWKSSRLTSNFLRKSYTIFWLEVVSEKASKTSVYQGL